MTTVSSFSRQNDAGLRALNVIPWEHLVLVVILVLESKALFYFVENKKKNISNLKVRAARVFPLYQSY